MKQHKLTCKMKLVIVIAAIIALIGLARAYAQEPVLATPDEQREMMTWIPPSCCVTNNCCFKVSEKEIRPLPDDYWLIVATGQHIKRTDWSQNGHNIRCACDMQEGVWVVHEKARTRCIFPILQSAGRQ